jgi:hypothetical protein
MLMMEGFATFGRSWRDWMKLALVFFALWLVVALIGVSFLSDTIHVIIAMKPDPKHTMTPDEAKAFLATLNVPAFSAFCFLATVLSVVQYYMMVTFYSDKDKLFGHTVTPTVGGFFYTFWKTFLAMLISMSPIFGAIILGAIAAAVKLGWVVVLVILISMAAMLFLGIKYVLVFPLAANGLQSPVRASWHLTNKNWWPLLGNGIVLFTVLYFISLADNLVVGLCVGIPAGISAGLSKMDPKDMTQYVVYATVVLICINTVLFSGINAAYKVACVRILDQEKSNPAAPI